MKKGIKLSFLLLGLAIVSALLHNLIYALFKVEEPVFFILTLLFFLGAIISVIYNIIRGLIS